MMRKRKKIRMNQRKFIISLVVIILAIIIIVAIVNKSTKPNDSEQPNDPVVVELPETTYSDMQVKNIVMELLKGNAQDGSDQTMISFEIVNTTENKVETQMFDAVLMNENGEEIATMPYNYIEKLEVGESQRLNVIYNGDLTATTQIKLIEK